MSDTIHIHLRNCVVPLFVGIYDHEKPQTQPVLFAVEAIAPLTQRYDDIKSANMASVINYEKLYNFVTKTLPGLGHVPLLESLGERVMDFCFEDPRITSVHVRLEKPEAFAGSVVVAIEMRRQRRAA